MRLLLLAPHQDDEILGGGGMIQQCMDQGIGLWVLFATNGDRFGVDVARQRYDESHRALAELGVPEHRMLYMGYGDTGMAPERSFLSRLRSSPAEEAVSSYTSAETYHPAGKKTIRALRAGQDGPMTRAAFLSDLVWAIETCRPDFALSPSPWDAHGDHAALAMLLGEVLPPSLPCGSYLIHGGEDAHWPQRHTDFFQKPFVLPQRVWSRRLVIPLSDEQQRKKRRMIACFPSQIERDTTGFLPAFAKREEIFFPWCAISQRKI